MAIVTKTIDNKFKNKQTGDRNSDDSRVYIPGAGVFYEFGERLGFLLGVNKGYSPAPPSLSDNIDPEESVQLGIWLALSG